MRRRLEQSRLGAAFLAAWGVVVGAAPHVLHHIGPLAGAAFLAGAGGTLVFGAVGLVLSAVNVYLRDTQHSQPVTSGIFDQLELATGCQERFKRHLKVTTC